VCFSPRACLLLLIGVGLGLFVGYVVGVARGIMRVINVTQKEDVFLPTGKLKFDKSKS
jgi:ABC-type dipeptide/oligopeptide/nickel transport system permease subunit